ncbi:MAG: VWA domain-containing protein [Planctomycetota bacterium]|nr:VWA domain-containing protein [Planctomycetota bacterium]
MGLARTPWLPLLCLLALAAPPVAADTLDEPGARAALAGLAAPKAAARLAALEELERLAHVEPRLVERALPRLKTILRLRSVAERARAVALLARVPCPAGRALWLARLDPHEESHEVVLAAAVAAPGDRPADADLLRRLLGVLKDPRATPERRALVLEALGPLDGAGVDLLLARPRKHEHWVEASARALALGRRGGTSAVRPLLALLEHAQLAPRIHARESLVRLTRQDLPPKAKPWRDWWKAQAGRLPVAPAPSEAGPRYGSPEPVHVPHYYGVPIPRRGSRVVFCLDASQSMYGGGIESARREMRRALMDFPSTHAFEVIVFNEKLLPWRERLVRAHPVQKLLAIRYLESIEPTSYTNLYDAVEMAFGHAGRGSRPRAPAAKIDAVFLLSDGAPNRGRHRAAKRVIAGIAAMSKREIPVHTIGAGEEVFALLMAIAKATGGEFIDAFE